MLLICLDTAAGGVTDSVGGPPGRLPEGTPIPIALLIWRGTAAGGVTDSVGGPPGRLPEGTPMPIFDMGLLTGGGG